MSDVHSVPWGAGQVAVPSSFTVILWQRQMGVIMPERVDKIFLFMSFVNLSFSLLITAQLLI